MTHSYMDILIQWRINITNDNFINGLLDSSAFPLINRQVSSLKPKGALSLQSERSLFQTGMFPLLD